MLLVAVALAGLIAFYLIVRMMIERHCARLREEFRQALDSIAVRLDSRIVAEVQPGSPTSGSPPDITAAIAAATAATGARKVHIRPVQVKPAGAAEDTWAQHGRAGVWSSHDIAQRWR